MGYYKKYRHISIFFCCTRILARLLLDFLSFVFQFSWDSSLFWCINYHGPWQICLFLLSCNLFNVNWFLFLPPLPCSALSFAILTFTPRDMFSLLRLLVRLLEMLISKCSQRSWRPQRPQPLSVVVSCIDSDHASLRLRLRYEYPPVYILYLPSAFLQCVFSFSSVSRSLFVVYLAISCYYHDIKNNKRGDSHVTPGIIIIIMVLADRWPGNCCACLQKGFGLGHKGEGYALDIVESGTLMRTAARWHNLKHNLKLVEMRIICQAIIVRFT